MNGVLRHFNLYLGDDDFRWPGFAGYTLRDLVYTDAAQHTADGVFYEHNKIQTSDLWDLFAEVNETNLTYGNPTVTFSLTIVN